MHTGLAATIGSVTDSLIKHYVQRARSIGLLIVEHANVSLDGKIDERQLGIYDDDMVEGLERLSSSIHSIGTPIVIQINHAGKSASKEITGSQPVAPSANGGARELQDREIETLVDTFGLAAERAIKAGFDGVEIHGAHGFLLNQFYSPLSNRRYDKYGGSLKNRMKFPLDVVERVKEKVGGRFLLYRLDSDDLDPKGTKIEDSQEMAMRLEEAGVDIIDVSGGLCGSRPTQLQDTPGYFVAQAEKIKEKVDIPVIGVGGITDPRYADKSIRKKKVDLVAIGRALMKDPEWAAKAIKILKDDTSISRKR